LPCRADTKFPSVDSISDLRFPGDLICQFLHDSKILDRDAVPDCLSDFSAFFVAFPADERSLDFGFVWPFLQAVAAILTAASPDPGFSRRSAPFSKWSTSVHILMAVPSLL
jgi:hypothetical protein